MCSKFWNTLEFVNGLIQLSRDWKSTHVNTYLTYSPEDSSPTNSNLCSIVPGTQSSSTFEILSMIDRKRGERRHRYNTFRITFLLQLPCIELMHLRSCHNWIRPMIEHPSQNPNLRIYLDFDRPVVINMDITSLSLFIQVMITSRWRSIAAISLYQIQLLK